MQAVVAVPIMFVNLDGGQKHNDVE